MTRRILGHNLGALMAAMAGGWLYRRSGDNSPETPEQRAARIVARDERRDACERDRGEAAQRAKEAAQRAKDEYESKAAPIREERRRRKLIAYVNRLPRKIRKEALEKMLAQELGTSPQDNPPCP